MQRAGRSTSPSPPACAFDSSAAAARTGAGAQATASTAASRKRPADEALTPRRGAGESPHASAALAPRAAWPPQAAAQQPLHHADDPLIGAEVDSGDSGDIPALLAQAAHMPLQPDDPALHDFMQNDDNAGEAPLQPDDPADDAQAVDALHAFLQDEDPGADSGDEHHAAGPAAAAEQPAGAAPHQPAAEPSLYRMNSTHFISDGGHGRHPAQPECLGSVATRFGFSRAVDQLRTLAPQERFHPYHRDGSGEQTLAPVRALYAKHRTNVADDPKIDAGFQAAAITALMTHEAKTPAEGNIHLPLASNGEVDIHQAAAIRQGVVAPYVGDQVGADDGAVQRIRVMNSVPQQAVLRVAQMPLADQRLVACLLPNGLTIEPAASRDRKAEKLQRSLVNFSACWQMERAALGAVPPQPPADSFAGHVGQLIAQGITDTALKQALRELLDRRGGALSSEEKRYMLNTALKAIEAELTQRPIGQASG
jgi:hypothetical protein